MKKIDNLVSDIEDVISGNGGWDATVSEHFRKNVGDTVDRRLNPEDDKFSPSLRMSNVANPCPRKLWYYTNNTDPKEPLPPWVKFKFLYGDILEDLLLSLAEAAGHTVEGQQDKMKLEGLTGHRDAVIDGMLVDVKSASPMAFKKFKGHQLKGYYNKQWKRYVLPHEVDSFGYIGQLSCYLAASEDDDLVTYKDEAAFLAVDKVHGHIVLDRYNLTEEKDKMKSKVVGMKALVKVDTPPIRPFVAEPHQKSGNMAIPNAPCGYCDEKHRCWDNLRGFAYRTGPVWLSKVVKEPEVKEIK